MTNNDYLVEAQKYTYISRIEVTERQIRTKSEVELDAFIELLNDKGMI